MKYLFLLAFLTYIHLQNTYLEYLPYHYLLTSMGKEGSLMYRDISTGEIVATHKTKIKMAGAVT